MIASGRVKVAAKSARKSKVKVALVIRQGDAKQRLTERKQLKLRPKRKASKRLALTDDGRRLVQSCIETKLQPEGQGQGARSRRSARR